MKLILNTKVVSRINRGAVTGVLLLLLLCITLTLSSAQSKQQKRITSIWTATNAAGSRVTVTSDVSLCDYEAYRRGDRFYVTIPQADLPSARGSLLGRGFDDVQIQRYADGIIISFHLQPGTAAHVDQNPNRLEIVFALPGRTQYNDDRSISSDSGNAAGRTRARRTQVAPTTAAVAQSFSRVPRYSTSETGAARGKSKSGANRDDSSRNNATGKTGADKSNTGSTTSTAAAAPSTQDGATAVASRSPSPAPSPVAAATLANPQGEASPANSGVQAPVVSSVERPSPTPTSNVAAVGRKIDFWGRVHYWRVYAELNPIPVLLGVLAAIVLLVLLVLVLRRFRSTLRRRLVAGGVSREGVKKSGTPPVVPSGVTPQKQAEPATGAVATPLADAANSRSRAAAHGAHPLASAAPGLSVSEEEEREVFVL